MSSVRAFQPRRYDPPKFVAETGDDLAEMVGNYVGAGQCDNCGNATYRIALDGSHFFAICEADPDDDPEFKHPDPCGSVYQIAIWDEDLVEF